MVIGVWWTGPWVDPREQRAEAIVGSGYIITRDPYEMARLLLEMGAPDELLLIVNVPIFKGERRWVGNVHRWAEGYFPLPVKVDRAERAQWMRMVAG